MFETEPMIDEQTELPVPSLPLVPGFLRAARLADAQPVLTETGDSADGAKE